MSKRNRPFGVTAIAVLYGIAATFALVKWMRGEVMEIPIFVFDISAVALITWGLWNLARWGRVLAIGWSSFAILYGLYKTPTGLLAMTKGSTYPIAIALGRTLLHGAVIIYLLQPKIAAVFNSRQSAAIGIEPKNPV